MMVRKKIVKKQVSRNECVDLIGKIARYYLGQASAATIIRCPFNLAACRVSIRILGIFFSAGTKMCFVALLPDGFSCSIPQY